MATLAATPAKAEKIARYRAARDRGARWLLAQLGPDGALGDVREGFHFYRAPWVMHLDTLIGGLSSRP